MKGTSMTQEGGSKLLIKNTFIIAIGGISVQMLSFCLLPLYTHYLSTGDFGYVDLVYNYTQLLGPVVAMQLGAAVFRYLVDTRGDQRGIAKVFTTAALSLGVLFVSFTPVYVVACMYFQFKYAIVTYIIIILGSLFGFLSQAARGLGKNLIFTISGIILGLVVALLNVIFIAMLKFGAYGMVSAMAISLGCANIYLGFALGVQKYMRIKLFNNALLKKMVTYSIPLVPSGILWWIITAADRTIITIFLGLGASGVYALATKFPMIFTALYTFFGMSWNEAAALRIADRDHGRFYSEVLTASVKFFGAMAAALIAGTAIVFDYVAAPQYWSAYNYVPVLILASFLSALVGNYGAIYLAKRLTKQVMNTSILAATINIVISVMLIKFVGMYATAVASVVGYGVMAIYRHYDTKKYVAITYERMVFVKVLGLITFASVLYYVNIFWLNIVNLVVVVAIAIWLNRSFVVILKEKVLDIHARFKRRSSPDVSPDLPL